MSNTAILSNSFDRSYYFDYAGYLIELFISTRLLMLKIDALPLGV